jgi:hypothetical protein
MVVARSTAGWETIAAAVVAADPRRRALDAFLRDMWALRLDVEGVQASAVKHGLAEEIKVTQPCGEECDCVAYGFPGTCVRLTSLLLNDEQAAAATNARIEALRAALYAIKGSACAGAWGEGNRYGDIERRAELALAADDAAQKGEN